MINALREHLAFAGHFREHSAFARNVRNTSPRSCNKVRDKVCTTLTKEIFTCGHVASQRSEGFNAVQKGRGAWRGDLKRMNHFQLASHLHVQFQQQQIEAQRELIDALQKGWKWGAQVHKLWIYSSSMLNAAGRKGTVVLQTDEADHQAR